MKNVKLSEIMNEREIKVENTEIVLKVRDLSWPEFMESLEIEDTIQRGIYRIEHVIVDLNLVDSEDKKVEVNKENIERIPANIMIPIVDAVKDCFGDQKKKITGKK